MPEVGSIIARTAKVLAFDCRGVQRTRIDDIFPLENSAQTPFAHTFKILLAKTPGALQWETTLKDLPRVTLVWNSVFKGVGIARIFLDGVIANTGILLSGHDRRGEAAVIESLADNLASSAGNTLRPAFDAFRAAEERPLIATLRFAAIDSEPK